MQKAQEFKANGTQRKQDYIDDLSKRYAKRPPEDRTLLDSAYAETMRKLAWKICGCGAGVFSDNVN